eukprot:SAG31_NODE_9243_length_1309_cov_1.161157_2_plen_167_part_00
MVHSVHYGCRTVSPRDPSCAAGPHRTRPLSGLALEGSPKHFDLQMDEALPDDEPDTTMEMFELAENLIPSAQCAVPDLLNDLQRRLVCKGSLGKHRKKRMLSPHVTRDQRMLFLFNDMLLLTNIQQGGEQVRSLFAAHSDFECVSHIHCYMHTDIMKLLYRFLHPL